MKFIKKLPRNAKFLYEDKCHGKHYQTERKIYVVCETKNKKIIVTFNKKDETV